MILWLKLLKLTRPGGSIIRTLSELWSNAQAVLFDFDGVLADSEPFYRKSWNTVLSDFDHSVSEKQYWKHWAFLGEGLEGEIPGGGGLLREPAAGACGSDDDPGGVDHGLGAGDGEEGGGDAAIEG